MLAVMRWRKFFSLCKLQKCRNCGLDLSLEINTTLLRGRQSSSPETCRSEQSMKRFITFLVLLTPSDAGAQSLLSRLEPERPLTLFPSDSSVLELHKPRHDLPCVVEPYKPQLDLDLMFQTGFRVTLPTKALAGTENMLTILFRVTAAKGRDQPVIFPGVFEFL